VGDHRLNSSGSAYGPVMDSHENSELLVSIKDR